MNSVTTTQAPATIDTTIADTAITDGAVVSDPSVDLAPTSLSEGAVTGRARRLAERGMVTAEYAVGILAAVALALVLLKVFHDNAVFTALLHYVTSLIGQLSSYIK